METLIMLLGAEFDGPLEDRTGLTGRVDIALEYRSILMERLEDIPTDSTTATAPALNDALRNQLGLRIEKTRGTFPVTIVRGRRTADTRLILVDSPHRSRDPVTSRPRRVLGRSR